MIRIEGHFDVMLRGPSYGYLFDFELVHMDLRSIFPFSTKVASTVQHASLTHSLIRYQGGGHSLPRMLDTKTLTFTHQTYQARVSALPMGIIIPSWKP